MTSFEPAQALIRFVTTLVERSLQDDDVAPSDRSASPDPRPFAKTTGNARSDSNANSGE
jgi:hypothetical protein